MKTLIFALCIITGLSGCTTVVYRDREVAAAPAPRVVEPVQVQSCPSGTTLTYMHDSRLGYTRPVCVTTPAPTETVVRESGPGFGAGVVTGIVGVVILQGLTRGHNRGYSGCNYNRCW